MAAAYLDRHPEVCRLIPGWAEDVDAEVIDGRLQWTYKIERGEVEASGIVWLDERGHARLEPTSIYLPDSTDDWPQSELVARLRALIADLTYVTDRIAEVAA